MWNTKIAQHAFRKRIAMAACTSSSSSEDVLSEGSDSSALNLYDSDGDNSENVQDAGPRPYQFEPRRVWRNDQRETTPNRLTATPIV